MEPLFTIITATFNASATVERTIASVDAQSCKDYEHLILDGASRDNTVDIIKKYPNPSRHINSEPDGGLYDAMNKGIGMACGKYLIFLNAGDTFHSPDTLAMLARAIERENFPGIVYGQTLIVDSNGKAVGERHLLAPEKLTLQSFAKGMLVCHQSFVPLRRISGFYNLKYRFSADYEWCIRTLQHSRRNVYIPDDYIADYLNEGLTTQNKLPSLFERFRIMCYYYGTLSTCWRHIGFALRAIRRRFKK